MSPPSEKRTEKKAGKTEILIFERMNDPSEKLVLKFEGKNPFRLAQFVKNASKNVWRPDSPDFYEPLLRWDASGDNRQFMLVYEIRTPVDKWTTEHPVFRCLGTQDVNTREGTAEIEFWGELETKYDYSFGIQRSIWWLYNHIFYDRQRQVYLENSRRRMLEFRKIMINAATEIMGLKLVGSEG